MAKKRINVDTVLEEIEYIKNQMGGLSLLLENKKHIISRYFDKTGERSVGNGNCTVFLQERTNIAYDIHAIEESLPKNKTKQFIETKYIINSWDEFTKLCKQYSIPASKLKELIIPEKSVKQEKLSDLYEKGIIELSDLEGCFTATVKKCIAFKVKSKPNEIKP